MTVEQPLERANAIGNAFGVVEAIDAEDDALVADAERFAHLRGPRPRDRTAAAAPTSRDRC